MKNLVCPMLLCAFLCSVSFANEDLKTNQRISVYLHPITLISSAIGNYLTKNESPFLLYLTGEIPLNKFNSLIVNPSMWAGGLGRGEEVFRLGSGIGIRHFVNRENQGLYLQFMGNYHYFLNLKLIDKIAGDEYISGSGSIADILVYIGHSMKFSRISFFSDFGLGYGRNNIKKKNFSEYSDYDWRLAEEGKTGLSFDINMGVGIPF
ncbi:MAG: hypothetical protein LBC64_06575 [Fibromonadaceae bacterium]|jgi:hypothetical protein|nr:hypothetical protein [Fibromonadaceae bacterium]